MTRLKFSRKLPWGAWGRNGGVGVSGLELLHLQGEDTVNLYIINSRGKSSPSVRIPVPKEDIPALIDALEKFR